MTKRNGKANGNGGSRNNANKTGYKNPPVEHQFKPGNPGRPKGSRNKLGEAFLKDMLEAWVKLGPDAINRVIAKKPEDFMKVVASLLPKDFNVNVNPLENMTDEQLLQRIKVLDAHIRPFIDSAGIPGHSGGNGPSKAH